MQKICKMLETLANRYSSYSSQRELSHEYEHDRVLMVFKIIYTLVLLTKVGSALEELRGYFLTRSRAMGGGEAFLQNSDRHCTGSQ